MRNQTSISIHPPPARANVSDEEKPLNFNSKLFAHATQSPERKKLKLLPGLPPQNGTPPLKHPLWWKWKSSSNLYSLCYLSTRSKLSGLFGSFFYSRQCCTSQCVQTTGNAQFDNISRRFKVKKIFPPKA